MTNWLKSYLAQTTIQPLVADIKMGQVKPSTVMLAIQKLSDEEKKEMAPAFELVMKPFGG